jgi:2-haloalkanoic acid dehalogenase type II
LESLKAITLDLDDTLWPSAPAIAAAEAKLHAWLESVAPAMAAALPPSEFMRFRRALAAEMPHIAHDFTATRHEALKRALTLHGEDHTLADAAMDLFLTARSEVELYPDAREALERLAARFKLVALSNGNADLARIGLDHHFACILNARIAGVAKPDARIFQAACTRVAVAAGEVLHAGDDPDLDVRAAARAGLRAAWINRSGNAWTGEHLGHEEFCDLLALCDALGA